MEETRLRRFAYEQAELVRLGRQTRDEALARIAAQFPNLAPAEARQALATGLFESR